jgi:hypothetical protein
MKTRLALLAFCLLFSVHVFPQEKVGKISNKKWWKQVKKEMPEYKFLFNEAEKYRFEIIYGQVDTDKKGNKKITYYQTGKPGIYFYPASLVKLPVAVKLLEWLSFENAENLRDLYLRTKEKTACGFHIGDTARNYYGITRQTMHPHDLSVLLFSYYMKSRVYDSLANVPDSIPANTIIKLTDKPVAVNVEDILYEMLVQSDNANYNQVFEAIAARNSDLDNLFYIPRPFIPCKDEYTSAGADFYLYDEKWKSLPGGNVQKKYDAHIKKEKVGIAQITGEKDTLKTARNFSAHNHVSLLNITHLLQEIIYPGSINISLLLSKQNRSNLLRMLAANPRYSTLATKPEYLQTPFNKTNFLFPSTDTSFHLREARFYNITGLAYGFSSDVLYYCNPEKNIEFFLSVRIYTNEDEILNDDKYEYETIAQPFMRSIFNYIYAYEKKRKIKTPNRLLNFP